MPTLRKQRLFLNSSDELLLHYCCTLAWQHQSLALPNPSVGAVVADQNGNIISSGVHIIAGSPHAEIIAMQKAYSALSGDKKILECKDSESIHRYLLESHKGIFAKCSLYVSLEPCNHYGKTPPCATLVASLGFAKVCIATCESNLVASGGLAYLAEHNINVSYIQSPTLKHIAQSLLIPFNALRTKRRFVLFKLATRLDGSYKNGYISCESAQIFTHNQRSICDYICISGATLRHDNPMLNARYAIEPYNNKHLPQVLVISRKDTALTQTNPSIKERIRFSHNPQDLEHLCGFIIIEGGWDLLESCRKYVDMILLIQSTKCINGEDNRHSFNGDFSFLHQMNLGEDIALWLQ